MATPSIIKFLRSIEDINSGLKDLPEATECIKHLQRQFNGAVKEEDQKRIREGLRDAGSAFTSKTKAIKQGIAQVKKRNDRYKSKNGETKEYQTRNMQFQGLTRRLAKAIEEFRRLQVSFNEAEKERLRTQYVIAKPNATPRELEDLETGDRGKAVLESAFTIGSRSARKVVEDAEKRHDSIQGISKSIKEVSGLTEELNVMIHTSGATVDKIDIKAKATAKTAEHAKKDLAKAEVYQRRSTYIKRLIVAGALLLFLLLILALVVFIVIALLQQFGGKLPSSGNSTSTGGGTTTGGGTPAPAPQPSAAGLRAK